MMNRSNLTQLTPNNHQTWMGGTISILQQKFIGLQYESGEDSLNRWYTIILNR